MKSIIQISIAIITISTISLFSVQSQACTCATLGTAEEFERSEAVFTGRVTEISSPDTGSVITTFEVIKTFKGNAENGELIKIHSDVIGPSCGIEFDIDQEYLVFTSTYEGHLFTSSCSLTSTVAEAQDIIKELGE